MRAAYGQHRRRKTMRLWSPRGGARLDCSLSCGVDRLTYAEFQSVALERGIGPGALMRALIVSFLAKTRAETSPASAQIDSNTSLAPAGQEACARYPHKSQGGT